MRKAATKLNADSEFELFDRPKKVFCISRRFFDPSEVQRRTTTKEEEGLALPRAKEDQISNPY